MGLIRIECELMDFYNRGFYDNILCTIYDLPL